MVGRRVPFLWGHCLSGMLVENRSLQDNPTLYNWVILAELREGESTTKRFWWMNQKTTKDNPYQPNHPNTIQCLPQLIYPLIIMYLLILIYSYLWSIHPFFSMHLFCPVLESFPFPGYGTFRQKVPCFDFFTKNKQWKNPPTPAKCEISPLVVLEAQICFQNLRLPMI